jgi:hypothetical protein
LILNTPYAVVGRLGGVLCVKAVIRTLPGRRQFSMTKKWVYLYEDVDEVERIGV